MTDAAARAACPYCGVIYAKPPAATRKCPDCGSKVVRRTRGDSIFYFTEEQAKQYDDERVGEARARAMLHTEEIGLGATDYERAYQALTQQYGFVPPPGDVFWRLANERIGQLGDHRLRGHDSEQVCRVMARAVLEEHRPYKHVLKIAHRSRLIWEQQRIVTSEGPRRAKAWRAVISADACCSECAQLNGRTYTLEEAIAARPLPPDACSAEWCSCGWLVQAPS